MRLDDQLCFALYSATNAIVRTYRPMLRELGLTYPQYLVLLVLWQDGERTMGEIATRLSLPPGAITPIVERLEAAGLVKRRRDEHDRRVIHLMVTPASAELRDGAAAAQQRVVSATMLPPEDLLALRDALTRLTQHLTKEAAPKETIRECA